jgi:hypothetical protein
VLFGSAQTYIMSLLGTGSSGVFQRHPCRILRWQKLCGSQGTRMICAAEIHEIGSSPTPVPAALVRGPANGGRWDAGAAAAAVGRRAIVLSWVWVWVCVWYG